MNTYLKTISAGAAFIAAVSFANANTTFISHSGSTDPTTEGWSASGTSTLGSAVNDGGVNAWAVNDNSSSAALLYLTNVTSSAEAFNESGWSLDVTLRATDTGNANDFTRYVDFADSYSNTYWGMDFGSTAEGYTTVTLRGSALSHSFTDTDYHSLSLVYDTVAGSASLYIDGASTAALTGYTGFSSTISTGLIRWGSLSGGATGSANYSAVSFSTIPEPSVTVLASALAVIGLCVFKRRFTRN